MNFRDDHKPPLWIERSDLTWETGLTENERDLLDLDERPSRLSLLLGTAAHEAPAGEEQS